MYAVIKTGGKQHKVELDQTFEVELLDKNAGDEVVFDEVLLVSDGDNVSIGQPLVDKASVKAKVVEETKGNKLTILRFRRRKHSMRTQGHRQRFHKVQVTEISLGK